MSTNINSACLVLALLAGASQNAYSVTCYKVVGRDNSVIYSATQPLFPLAGQGWTDGQQRLRASGQHLLWAEMPVCAEYDVVLSRSGKETRDPSRILSARVPDAGQ
jgi:hypothetical protein